MKIYYLLSRKERKFVHEFARKKKYISRSEYIKSRISHMKCYQCQRWINIEESGFVSSLTCSHCQKELYYYYDDIEDKNSKWIKTIIIMKRPESYKHLGNFRKSKPKHQFRRNF